MKPWYKTASLKGVMNRHILLEFDSDDDKKDYLYLLKELNVGDRTSRNVHFVTSDKVIWIKKIHSVEGG